MYGSGPPAIPADASRYATGWGLSPTFAKLIGISASSKPGLDNSNLGVDFTGNIDFGFAKLTSITAYNKLIRREYADWDATQFNDSDEYLNSDLDVFSQELRLAGNSGPFGWVAGVFYSNEDLRENFYSDLTDRLGALADEMSAHFKEMCDLLNISYDRFIRTSDSDHYAASQAIWCSGSVSAAVFAGVAA